MSQYAATHRRPIEPAETPTTITIRPDWKPTDPMPGGKYPIEFPVATRDAIIALQAAGYLVYEAAELPEVIYPATPDGKPKLPAEWGQAKHGHLQSRTELLYEEAFGKLALARWWEREAERKTKRIEALRGDIQDVPSRTDYAADVALAEYLVERGWHRG